MSVQCETQEPFSDPLCSDSISDDPLSQTSSTFGDYELAYSLQRYLESLNLNITLKRIIEQEEEAMKKISPQRLIRNKAFADKRQQFFTVLYEEAVDYVSMDTLCIAVTLLDRCFSRKPDIRRNEFKVYAIGSLFIACKLTSDFTVSRKTFCATLAPSLPLSELDVYERRVLSLLKYNIYVLSMPSIEAFFTPLLFEHEFFRLLRNSDREKLMYNWQGILLLTMKDVGFVKYRSMELVGASLWILLDLFLPRVFQQKYFVRLCSNKSKLEDPDEFDKQEYRFRACIQDILLRI
ncbi:meiosis specific cyclin Crs1 [Schizosaccharomyces japonicus yFS275]|uniref:Meiosis specific cyclin Crs1 n=1 Tax=Schizosaccharomyces japonicus (strain yFS275 / FY16936) TaxID=402676 RepID=B6JV00_SCHJY|nr:meiosis specific cyclin Crs1 [Schizosaccharomyces japonicus yFS275]EEB05104.2 meiosis specific cyclin Crs1 [Schizosaccharomyces japonicus yFS275]